MNPRVEYKMSEEDFKIIMEACQPTPVIKVGSYVGSTPQENANRAWRALGEKMGFDSMSVRPGKKKLLFTAVPADTEDQRKEKLKAEVAEKKRVEIETLEDEITTKQKRLAELRRTN